MHNSPTNCTNFTSADAGGLCTVYGQSCTSVIIQIEANQTQIYIGCEIYSSFDDSVQQLFFLCG